MKLPIPPELEHSETDERSILCFHHGFPSELVRWHCHDDYELHLIVATVGKAFVGDHVGGFSPGQLVLTGPGLPHNWISEVEDGESVEIRDRVVQFRQDLVPSMAAASSELKPLLPLLQKSCHGLLFHGTPLSASEPWFQRLEAADGPSRIALLLQFLEFLSHEPDQRLLSTLPMRAREDDETLDKVERVISFMSEHYAQNILLTEMADLIGMSESAFSRLFSKATGNNFSRFLNRVRVARACELLTATDEPITSICFAVGFNNVANFNRRFRDLKQVTPREYRRVSELKEAELLATENH
ncbi:MAG: helix-turn-helix domain-containing protein [Burkholderiaceae bacterium]